MTDHATSMPASSTDATLRLAAGRRRSLKTLAALTSLGSGPALLLTGCATPAPPPSLPQIPDRDLPWQEAVALSTDLLIAQIQPASAAGKLGASANAIKLTIDPIIDGATGQQTQATRSLEGKLVEHLGARHHQVQVLPFHAASLPQANYLLNGTFSRIGDSQERYQLNLVLIDLKTGKVAAHSAARAVAGGLDATPLAFFRDSPVVTADKISDAVAQNAQSKAGAAANADYLARLPSSTIVQQAIQAYNADRTQEALALNQAALAGGGQEQLRALSGVYITNSKLGRIKDAEQAFELIVSHGFANNRLGVKFLFNPGTTEFWSDTRISGAYPLWISVIARQALASKACLEIIGHTSKTGSAALNDRLSLQRAESIRRRLEAQASGLSGKTRASGRGFRETLVGLGSDDARDALDRRVEFKIGAC